ncbi:MAG: hypothetical protein HC884_10765 [Chloroflexaceae bacterium]|nr:hypothetical protein [Chloroflexaceae bacterium]
MAFVITLYAREGIVMASDSRLTLNTEQQKGEKQVVQFAVGVSDSNDRIFLLPNHIGLSTYGAADIQGVPIGVYIESFITEHLSGTDTGVDQVAVRVLEYFRQFDPPPATQFHVAGYKKEADGLEDAPSSGDEEEDDIPKVFRQIELPPDTHFDVAGHRAESGPKNQHIWHIDVAQNGISRLNASQQPGVSWGGEADILARLIQPVAIPGSKGAIKQVLPHFPIPWQFFTLQDAIDFCIFAVRTTIDALRFQTRPKTVGGPIDVLVIKPNRAWWIQRKILHGQHE